MTKDELIAALQADPSPGNTPVVRAVGGAYWTIREVAQVWRAPGPDHQLPAFSGNELPPGYGTLTLTLF